MKCIDYLKEDYILDFEGLKGKTILDVYQSGEMVIFTDEGTWTMISTKHNGYDEQPIICNNNTLFFALVDYHEEFRIKLEKYTNFELEKFKELRKVSN